MINHVFDVIWTWLSGHFNFLVLFGLLGQALFMMRFVAQWVHSEKMGRSAVPEIFWVFSIGGGLVLLIYAILKNDFVFIVGQSLGLFIYARNVFFIHNIKAKQLANNPAQILHELSFEVTELSAKSHELTPEELKAASEALVTLQHIKK
ncbi:MAG: lipid-A-disaccharide synthase N-terminal domain-containing protein [Alphaproteobacteria bacterium]|nr:lipid-A-disaccharide synthase N-terminal domain-containing protein [Alphaproteobacteria bacterium]